MTITIDDLRRKVMETGEDYAAAEGNYRNAVAIFEGHKLDFYVDGDEASVKAFANGRSAESRDAIMVRTLMGMGRDASKIKSDIRYVHETHTLRQNTFVKYELAKYLLDSVLNGGQLPS